MLINSAMLTGKSEQHLIDFHGHLLHWAIISDYQNLVNAAQTAGFKLEIASSFRNFTRQQTIWNNKFNAISPVYDLDNNEVDVKSLSEIDKCHAIMLYSALPGASRHHWGTDLDVYDAQAVSTRYRVKLQPHEYNHEGPFASLNIWLNEHIEQFGFYKPYDIYRNGIAAEPWHISHKSTAEIMLSKLKIKNLEAAILDSEVEGKLTLKDNLTEIFERYVININNE